jgi:hypothetical protein
LVVVVLLAPAWAPAQTEWVDDPANPVLVPGAPGTWDAWSYVNEVVLVDGTYHMFYMGQEEGSPFGLLFDIGHATSPDGSSWTLDPANPVLVRDAGGWDSDSVAFPAVLHDGTEFRMWYIGSDGEVDAVGYATSPDGTTWTKHAGNPVMSTGPAGSFDDASVWPGTVLFDGDKYRMWYTGEKDADDFIWAIGYAESEDGLSWTRHPEPVVAPDAAWKDWLAYAPTVVFDGSVYRMWHAGHSGSSIGIGHATSTDGVVWADYWNNPVITRGVVLDVSSAIYDDTVGSYRLWATDAVDEGFYAFTSDCCATVFASIIPAAAYAAGAEGSFYETDLDLSNAGAADAEYSFTWRPRGMTTSGAVTSDTFTLGAGQSVRYSNVLAEVFDFEPGVFGALVIDSTSPDLHAMARIANTPQEPGAGSFGQALSAVRPGDCTGHGVKRRLLFGTENADMRFNVGCINFSSEAARVSFELHRSDGTLLGTESLILLPWANDQLNLIFDPYRPVAGSVDYWNDLATGSVYCYGSLLDNVTSDPTTIPPM